MGQSGSGSLGPGGEEKRPRVVQRSGPRRAVRRIRSRISGSTGCCRQTNTWRYFYPFSEIPVDAKRAVNHPREDRRFEYGPRPKSTNWNLEWSRTCSVTPPSDGCRGLREDARTRMSIRTSGRCIGIVTRYAHLSRGRWVGRTRPRGRLRRGRRDVHFRCQTTKDRFSGSATPEGRAPPRRWTSREGKEPEWHSPPEEGDSSPRAAASARAGPVRGVVGQSITVGKETVTRE